MPATGDRLASESGVHLGEIPQVMVEYRDRIYQFYLSTKRNSSRIDRKENFQSPYLDMVIKRYFPADREAPILDLGCGQGVLVYFARRAGYRNTCGVDTSAEQVAEAERLGIDGISQGEVLQSLRSLADGSQNTVIAFDLIEHLNKDELLELVDEVRRVLEDGGRWIIHTPNAGSPFFGAIRYGDFTHEQAFTPSSINQLLLASDFRRVECFEDTPIPHGPRSFVRLVLWRLIRSMLRLYLAVETGSGGGDAIFTQNFLVVATR